MKLFYKEKIDNKRIIHILGIKIKYSKKDCSCAIPKSDINKQLNVQQWSELYNVKLLNSVIEQIKNKNYSVQTKELLNVVPIGSSVLEIGSGTGASSLCLAQKGCKVTALDYSHECLDLTKAAAKELKIDIDTVCADATKDLPFEEKQFDYIFHAGLLEHFTHDEQIQMLSNWRKYCKTMISLVPNASSLAYRVGKKEMEENGTWQYGVENPLLTQRDIFKEAGYKVEKEYSIGRKHSLNFLQSNSELRKILEKYIDENKITSDFNQGYLLVTIGGIAA